MPEKMKQRSDWFRRFLLPGFAFKAVVIGGGYATGRELATFFLPSGPRGGLCGMLLAAAVWSLVCILTFVFATRTGSRDYRAFFGALLGPFWIVFELAYVLALMVTLAVFAAASGAIGSTLFGWPAAAGALALMVAIAAVVTFGNRSVEALFKYVSIFLYAVYACFLVLSLRAFGGGVAHAFASSAPAKGWVGGGLTYASYNAIGAVVILPMLRHLRGDRDAVVAGLLAGPLAMLPAILFFIAMAAFYPQIGAASLPSDFLLTRLNLPAFRYVFQAMMFAALLESGAGGMHAINERVADAWTRRHGSPLPSWGRLLLSGAILILSVFVAVKIGLIQLIARGYALLAVVFLLVFLAPLLTLGVWRIARLERLAPLRPT